MTVWKETGRWKVLREQWVNWDQEKSSGEKKFESVKKITIFLLNNFPPILFGSYGTRDATF